jgi:hypothetical protein
VEFDDGNMSSRRLNDVTKYYCRCMGIPDGRGGQIKGWRGGFDHGRTLSRQLNDVTTYDRRYTGMPDGCGRHMRWNLTTVVCCHTN